MHQTYAASPNVDQIFPAHLNSVCSYCKKVRTDQQWFDPDELSFTVDARALSHSACPSCHSVAVIAMLEEIREELQPALALG